MGAYFSVCEFSMCGCNIGSLFCKTTVNGITATATTNTTNYHFVHFALDVIIISSKIYIGLFFLNALLRQVEVITVPIYIDRDRDRTFYNNYDCYDYDGLCDD